MLQKKQHGAKIALRPAPVKGEYNEICRPQPLPAASPRYAWSVLAFNIAVVLWGAFVRATGAGAGCGKHWPLCNGEMLPRSPSLNTIIEFTHRVTSGIDLALVALLVVWAFRAFPRRHAVRLGAVLSAVFLFTEALLGAALVLLEHVAGEPIVGAGLLALRPSSEYPHPAGLPDLDRLVGDTPGAVRNRRTPCMDGGHAVSPS